MTKKWDFWLCFSVALYAFNLAGWAAYAIWKILNA